MKKVLLSLAGAALFAVTAVSFSACSSSTTSSGDTPAEAGTDARKEAGSPVDEAGTDAAQTFDECNAACEAAHPSGLVLDKKIDDCWTANCQGPCLDDPSTAFDGGTVDGGDGGAPMCQQSVDTSDVNCDQCTNALCCASWDGCFNDTDCTALNDCRGKCPAP